MNVRNPRTGQVDYQFESSANSVIADTVAQVRSAQPGWFAGGLAHRVAVLRAFSEALDAHRDELCQQLVIDTGRVAESFQELDGVRNAIDHWCERAPTLLAPAQTKATRVPFVHATVSHAPYTAAGIIAPWNFPLLLSFIDALPGLLAGTAMVIKPSEVTPRFLQPLQRALDSVPELAAVCRLICGGPEAGRCLTAQVDVLFFTGSVATGKKVAVAAAEQFIPVHLELGGNDPAIVFADAQIERAAAAISWGATANAGQSCLSIERVYVQREVFTAFVEALVSVTSRLQLSRADPNKGQIGPLINAPQAQVIQQQLTDAVAKGATIRCGGKVIEDGGLWCEPTVVTDVTHDMLLMRDETFGPIIPVMAFADEAHAVALANDTDFGLSAAVFSDDLGRLHRVAGLIEAGAISANDVCLTAFVHEGAKQARKLSGLGGSRMGDRALARFLRSGVVLDNIDQAWDPWWFEQARGGRV